MTEDWITLKEASALMRQNEKKLRIRNKLGEYLYFPELSRIQPGGPCSSIWFLRFEIEEWVRQVEEAARRRSIAIVPHARGVGENEALIETLMRMGAHKAVKTLRSVRS